MKKIDFAVGLDIADLVEPETVSLSPMADAYTQAMPQLCPLEFKRHGGDFEEAGLQLMVWQSASLAHLQFLKAAGRIEMSLPPKVPLGNFILHGKRTTGMSWSLDHLLKLMQEQAM